jgi:hypothetical protein
MENNVISRSRRKRDVQIRSGNAKQEQPDRHENDIRYVDGALNAPVHEAIRRDAHQGEVGQRESCGKNSS